MTEVSVNIQKEIEDNQIIVLVVASKEYAKKLKGLVHHLSQRYKKICYVNLNKPLPKLIKEFEEQKIDVKKFYFIDAVTRDTGEYERVLHVHSPGALTELGIAIRNVISSARTDCIIFDSMSTLLLYNDPVFVVKFIHNVMSLLITSPSKGIFISLKKDMKKDLMMDLNMFADKIINL